MKRFSRILAVTLVAVMALSLALCGGALAQEKKTLNVWHLWTTESDANAKSFNIVLKQWQELHPDVEVVIDATENEAYKTKLKTAMAANEVPDVFFAWGGGFAKPFVEAGQVLALDDYLADGTKDRLLGGALDNVTYGGKTYGLTFIQWVGTLYCNKEMFDANGVTIPTTNDELLAAVAAFKAKGIVPFTVGAKDGWPAMFYQNVYAVRTAGAKLSNEALSGASTFNAPEFVQSAKYLDDLVKAGAFDPGALALTYDEAKIPFLAGQVPMIYIGSWLAGEIQDPKLSQVVDKVVGVNWPSIADGKGEATEILGGAIDSLMVSNNAKDKDLAVEFVKYITENMSRESFKLGAGIATWKIDMTGITVSPLVQNIIDIASKSTGSVLAWDTFLSGEAAERHKSLVQEIFAGQKTPEEFAAEMEKLQK
jgi:raffinose/stachyose/melibiose transport system substrate-binding protein